MKNIRILPRIDIKGSNVVKGVHTEGLRVVGSPKELASKYYKEGADEIIYIDIVASLYQRNLDFELLKEVSENIFIPLTVGGGIRSTHDINNALRSGADKIAINTYAIQNPSFISRAVRNFGSQCIVVSIEAKKTAPGKWEAYTEGGRERTGIDAIEWAKKVIKIGVGEILITSIDKDGTGDGYELDLISQINSFASIPIIAHGGAGNVESVKKVILETACDAVSISSSFHYGTFAIPELKKYMSKNNIHVRK